jgi:Tol biopolymer transport system component
MRRQLLRLVLSLALCLLWSGRLSSETIPPTGHVAYVSGKSLWVQNLATGERRSLDRSTVGIFRSLVSPRWSSTGRHLVFRTDGLQIMRADGTDRRSLHGAMSAPSWSPTAERLAYWRRDGWLQIETPSGEVRPVFQSKKQFEPPVWSPDGQWLAYVEGIGSPPKAKAELGRAPAHGGAPESLFTLGSTSYPCLYPAAWPAADRLLVWYQDTCSASLAMDGIALGAVSLHDQKLYPIVAFTRKGPIAVAPTGDVAVAAGYGRYAWRTKQVLLLRAGQFEPQPVSPAGQAAIQPAFSPDGQSLVWSGMPEAEPDNRGEKALRQRRLWLKDLRTGALRQLTEDPMYRDEAPVWTSDGDHLLFTRLDSREQASLWLLPLRSGTPRKLADLDPPKGDEPYYGWLDWGRVFAYSPGAR